MKSKTLIVTILILLSVVYAQAQRRPQIRNTPPTSKVTKQMATTDAGRKVELNSDGTWRYADTLSEIDVERPTPRAIISELNGITYKLQRCQFISNSKVILCDLEITNNQNDDLRLSFAGNDYFSYNDNLGNEVKEANSATLANAGRAINLISNVPVKAKVTFRSADPTATKITRLIVAISPKGVIDYVEFRDIPLQR